MALEVVIKEKESEVSMIELGTVVVSPHEKTFLVVRNGGGRYDFLDLKTFELMNKNGLDTIGEIRQMCPFDTIYPNAKLYLEKEN